VVRAWLLADVDKMDIFKLRGREGTDDITGNIALSLCLGGPESVCGQHGAVHVLRVRTIG
jgi:hypothetical protein